MMITLHNGVIYYTNQITFGYQIISFIPSDSLIVKHLNIDTILTIDTID